MYVHLCIYVYVQICMYIYIYIYMLYTLCPLISGKMYYYFLTPPQAPCTEASLYRLTAVPSTVVPIHQTSNGVCLFGGYPFLVVLKVNQEENHRFGGTLKNDTPTGPTPEGNNSRELLALPFAACSINEWSTVILKQNLTPCGRCHYTHRVLNSGSEKTRHNCLSTLGFLLENQHMDHSRQTI